MKSIVVMASGLLISCAAPVVSPPRATPSGANAVAIDSAQRLVGSWVVDLRSSPKDAPYTQTFVVESIDTAGRTIKGRFYGSEISWARINTEWGNVVVTFVTSDGAGEYVHTATLQNDMLVGSSTAKHRNLLVPWTAARSTK